MRRAVVTAVLVLVVAGTCEPTPASHVRFGGTASWYTGSYGACGKLVGRYAAHRTLPCGTVLKVKRAGTKGPWIRAVVRDRGPYVAGRVLDLKREQFAKLAPLGAGVVKVRARVQH